MENARISILERFDTISIIMPYFAPTHRAFLLLSALSIGSRRKLDEFYEEFVKYMGKYWMCLKILPEELSKYIFFPSDLFVFDIWNIFNQNLPKFLQFIENWLEFKGWYFNNHYMHLQIKIQNSILVHYKWIERLDIDINII